jgi:hypothetical protein
VGATRLYGVGRFPLPIAELIIPDEIHDLLRWSDLGPGLPRHLPNSSTAGWLPRANAIESSPGTYSFGYFGRFNYRKNIIALFEVHSLDPVVIIDVTFPDAVQIRTSDTTLSETIFSIVPARRFRMLVLTVGSFPQVAD